MTEPLTPAAQALLDEIEPYLGRLSSTRLANKHALSERLVLVQAEARAEAITELIPAVDERCEREAEARVTAEAGFLADVAAEIAKARAKHAPMNSLHEGYAVILEELDEFWEEVRAWRGSKGTHDPAKARKELVQVAAMAMRCADDLLAAPPTEPVE